MAEGNITIPKTFDELTPRQREQTLDNYNVYDAGQKQAFDEIKDNIDRWFLFYGKPGTGKGHIAIGIYKQKKSEGLECKYVIALDLNYELKSVFHRERKELMERYIEPDYLIIDEFEKFGLSNKETEKELFYCFYHILNMRYEYKKQTIIITNFETADEIYSMLSKEVADRFKEVGKSIQFDWESWRGRECKNDIPK